MIKVNKEFKHNFLLTLLKHKTGLRLALLGFFSLLKVTAFFLNYQNQLPTNHKIFDFGIFWNLGSTYPGICVIPKAGRQLFFVDGEV